MSSIVGKWIRYAIGVDFYYSFDSNGMFETDEIPGVKICTGRYSYNGSQLLLFSENPPGMLMLGAEVRGNKLVVTLPGEEILIYERD